MIYPKRLFKLLHVFWEMQNVASLAYTKERDAPNSKFNTYPTNLTANSLRVFRLIVLAWSTGMLIPPVHNKVGKNDFQFLDSVDWENQAPEILFYQTLRTPTSEDKRPWLIEYKEGFSSSSRRQDISYDKPHTFKSLIFFYLSSMSGRIWHFFIFLSFTLVLVACILSTMLIYW